MGTRLKGTSAVVTGAGRGIGRAIAELLAAEGAAVVVNDLGGAVDGSGSQASVADEVVAAIKAAGGKAVANHDSVTDFAAAERIVATAVKEFGAIDILVNNAGILRDRMIFNMTEADWDAVVAVHLKGTFNCTRHAAVQMRQQKRGRVISMSSTSGTIQPRAGELRRGRRHRCDDARRRAGWEVRRHPNAVCPGAATRATQTVGDGARPGAAEGGHRDRRAERVHAQTHRPRGRRRRG
jgi:NAD(P)-dependent dehydrogenase (short-subunit alcohol dehydrogenase family)